VTLYFIGEEGEEDSKITRQCPHVLLVSSAEDKALGAEENGLCCEQGKEVEQSVVCVWKRKEKLRMGIVRGILKGKQILFSCFEIFQAVSARPSGRGYF
jgi:hypothetical protein